MASDYDRAHSIYIVVAQLSGLRPKVLVSPNRTSMVTRVRDTALYLIRKHTSLAFPDIARMFGRNHSTVMSGCRREEMRLVRNPPRVDGRKWADWHTHVMDEVRKLESAAPDTKVANVGMAVIAAPVVELDITETETPDLEHEE